MVAPKRVVRERLRRMRFLNGLMQRLDPNKDGTVLRQVRDLRRRALLISDTAFYEACARLAARCTTTQSEWSAFMQAWAGREPVEAAKELEEALDAADRALDEGPLPTRLRELVRLEVARQLRPLRIQMDALQERIDRLQSMGILDAISRADDAARESP